MRVHLFCGTIVLAACVTESQRPPPASMPPPPAAPDRSQDALREIERQQRSTANALAARPPADELQAVRDGDADAVSDTRRRLRRLVTAVERTTWIRDTVPEVLRGSSNPDRLIAAFDGAARDRNEAFAAADAAALALATSRSRNAISLDDLKRALQSAHSARESEQRLASNLGRAARNAAGPDPLQRLQTVPMPPQTPFVQATARYLSAHPGEDRGMDAWPPQLAQERTEIRAAAADVSLSRPEAADGGMGETGAGFDEDQGEAPPQGSDAGSGDAVAETDAGASAAGAPAKSEPVQVTGDLKRLLSRRGPPLSISQRPDGLTAFRYREERPCGVDRCMVSVDYLFDSKGRLMRSEVVKP